MKPTKEVTKGAYVEALYAGNRYHGIVSNINERWQDATVTMAPGVSMLLPLADLTVLDEKTRTSDNGIFDI